MTKDIKDYLHLYLNQVDVIIDSVTDAFKPHFGHAPGHKTQLGPMLWVMVFEGHVTVKPILRPLSSMTEAENKRWKAKMHKQYSGGAGHTGYLENPESFRYLLSIGIDLFGLIDSGLAVTAETLK